MCVWVSVGCSSALNPTTFIISCLGFALTAWNIHYQLKFLNCVLTIELSTIDKCMQTSNNVFNILRG